MILKRVVVLVRFVRSPLSHIVRDPQCALSTGGQGACCVLRLSLGPGLCAQESAASWAAGGLGQRRHGAVHTTVFELER